MCRSQAKLAPVQPQLAKTQLVKINVYHWYAHSAPEKLFCSKYLEYLVWPSMPGQLLLTVWSVSLAQGGNWSVITTKIQSCQPPLLTCQPG